MTPGPVTVGSRRRATVRRFGGGTMENEIEVTAVEPGRRIAVRSVQAPVPFTSAWTFTPVDAATRVDWRWTFELGGWLRPVDPIFRWAFARSFRKDLGRLKMLMESGAL